MKIVLALAFMILGSQAKATELDLCKDLAGVRVNICEVADNGSSLIFHQTKDVHTKISAMAAKQCAFFDMAKDLCISALLINPNITASEIQQVHRSSIKVIHTNDGKAIMGLDYQKIEVELKKLMVQNR